MLYFEKTKEEKKELTTKNYKAVKIDYEGEPIFIMKIDKNYNLFLLINEIGETRIYDDLPDNYHWGEIVDNIYDIEFDTWTIVDYYEDFDITITKRD